MHHRMGDLDPRRPAVGEDASRLALQDWHQPPGDPHVVRLHLQRCRQLPLELFREGHQTVDVLAAHDQRGRAKHLVAQPFVRHEILGVRGEQRARALVDALTHPAAGDGLDLIVLGQRLDPGLVGLVDAGGQHRRRRIGFQSPCGRSRESGRDGDP